MQEDGAGLAPAPARQEHTLEFRGTGSEYFRIWIVNLALTILTLGIYGAWAKVRTWRYFYANTYLAGHSFDYHASPVRILIGRAIALVLFLAYSISGAISPILAGVWVILFIFALPWLATTSLRFNARNTSYRNIRFNFTGTYSEAFVAYILWTIAGILTVGILMPRARKAMDYFYVNHHTYGGRHFNTEFSAWSIFFIYLTFVGVYIVMMILFVAGAATIAMIGASMTAHGAAPPHMPGEPPPPVIWLAGGVVGLVMLSAAAAVQAMIYNLVIGNTMLDGRHELQARLSPFAIVWIMVSNVFMLVVTLGFFYPWAMVRIARYRRSRTGVIAMGDLDDFTADVAATQSAVGEEIASFFDMDFGL